MNLTRKNILIVEDDGAIVNAIREGLSNKGNYHFETAHSFNSALGIWDEAPAGGFHCIVLDRSLR